MKNSVPYKRSWRNYLINPSYQIRYTFWLCSTGFTLVVLNGLIFYRYVKENYMLLVELSPMTDEAKGQLFSELNSILWKLVGASLLFMLVVGVLGIVASHRTAGALYHFKRVFREIRAGNRSLRIRLRPRDEFHDVADEFNSLMDQLSSSAK